MCGSRIVNLVLWWAWSSCPVVGAQDHCGRAVACGECSSGERDEALECCCGRSGHCDGSDGADDGPTAGVGNGFVGQKHGAD